MSLHEIRGKIDSVDNIRQITRAMEMVAASKMRRAEQRMAASRPYAKQMAAIVGRLARGKPEYRHPWMRERPVRRVGMIVVSSDRGLCGGLNAALFRAALTRLQEFEAANVAVDLCTIGAKAQAFFARLGCNLLAHAVCPDDEPKIETLIGAVRVMLDDFAAGTIDRLDLSFNKFVNVAVQQPVITQLLPLVPEVTDQPVAHWDYLYEPEARPVVTRVLERFVESQLYQAVVENVACEQAARMVAMQAASSNAGDIIDELRLDYNKSRQARITRELAEIVGGSKASRRR